MGKAIDITGERYGKLVAISKTDERNASGGICWLFKCDCGNEKVIPANAVRTGAVKSCGCLNRPHGETGTRLYNIWNAMKQRCKIDNDAHKYWAGKHIHVCEEWNDYLTFKKWAIKNGYKEGLTIDRIDSNGNYEPSNCRWATYKEQANNMSSNHPVTINGETHNINEWCRILNISDKSMVYNRVKKYGWSYEQALLTPTKHGGVLNPESDKRLKERGSPMIAYNDDETLYFPTVRAAVNKGFKKRSIYKAIVKHQMHYGYYWKYPTEDELAHIRELEAGRGGKDG